MSDVSVKYDVVRGPKAHVGKRFTVRRDLFPRLNWRVSC